MEDIKELVQNIKNFDASKFKLPEVFSDFDGKTSGAKFLAFLFGIVGLIIALLCGVIMAFLTFHKAALETGTGIDAAFIQSVLTLFVLPCETVALGAFVTHKIMDKDRTNESNS